MPARKRRRSTGRRGRARGRVRGSRRGKSRGARSKSSGKSGKSTASGKLAPRTGGAIINEGFRAGKARGKAGRRLKRRQSSIRSTSSKASNQSTKPNEHEERDIEYQKSVGPTKQVGLEDAYSSYNVGSALVRTLGEPHRAEEELSHNSADDVEIKLPVGYEEKKDAPASPHKKYKTGIFKNQAVNTSFEDFAMEQALSQAVVGEDLPSKTTALQNKITVEAALPRSEAEEPIDTTPPSTKKPTTKNSLETRRESRAVIDEVAEQKFKTGRRVGQGINEGKPASFRRYLRLPEFLSSPSTPKNVESEVKETQEKQDKYLDKEHNKESLIANKGSEDSYESDETLPPEPGALKYGEEKKLGKEKRSMKKSRYSKERIQKRNLKHRRNFEDDEPLELGGRGTSSGPSYFEEVTEELFEPDATDWIHVSQPTLRPVHRTRAVRRPLDVAVEPARPLTRPSSSKHWRRGIESSSLDKEAPKRSYSLEFDFRTSGRQIEGTLRDSQWESHTVDERFQAPIRKHKSTSRSGNQPRLMAENIRHKEQAHACLQNDDWPAIWQREDDDAGGFYTKRPEVPGTAVDPGRSRPENDSRQLFQRNIELPCQRGNTDHKPFNRTPLPARFGNPMPCQLCDCPGCWGKCCLGTLKTDIRLGEPISAREKIEAEELLKDDQKKQKEHLLHEEIGRIQELEAVRKEEERRRLEEKIAMEDRIRQEERKRMEERREAERLWVEEQMRYTERQRMEEQMRQTDRMRIEEQIRLQERVRMNERMRLQEQLPLRDPVALDNLRSLSYSFPLDQRIDRDLVVQTLVEEAARQRLLRELLEEELQQRTKPEAAISVYKSDSSGTNLETDLTCKQERRVADIPRWSKRRCSYTGLQESETHVVKKGEFRRPPKLLSLLIQPNQIIHQTDLKRGAMKGPREGSGKASILRTKQYFRDDSNDLFQKPRDSSAVSLEMSSLEADEGSTAELEKQQSQKFVWVFPPLPTAARRLTSKNISYMKHYLEKPQESKIDTSEKVGTQELSKNHRKMLAENSTISEEESQKRDSDGAVFSEPTADHRESIETLMLRQVFKSRSVAGAPGKKSVSTELSTWLQSTLTQESPLRTSADVFHKVKTSEAFTSTNTKELKSAAFSAEKASDLQRPSISDRNIDALSTTKKTPRTSSRSSVKPGEETTRSPRTSEAGTSRLFQTAGLPSDSKTERTDLLESEPLVLKSQLETQFVSSVPNEQSEAEEYVGSVLIELSEKEQRASVAIERSEKEDYAVFVPKSEIKSAERAVVEEAPMVPAVAVILPPIEDVQALQIQAITTPAIEEEDEDKGMEITDTQIQLFPESGFVAIIGLLCVAWIILLLISSSVVHQVQNTSRDLTTGSSYSTEPSKSSGTPEGVYYCESEQCLREGSYLNSLLDEARSPCDDFYDHVCGRWPNSEKDRKGEIGWAVTSNVLLQEALEASLVKALEDPMNRVTVGPAMDLFGSCMNRPSVHGSANAYARNLFANWIIRKWPVPTYRIDVNHGQVWRFAGQLVRDLGAGILATISVAVDPVNYLRSVVCLDSPMPLYFVSDSIKQNPISHFRDTLLQVAIEFIPHGTVADRQLFSDEVFSALERLDKISFESALSAKKTKVVSIDTLNIGIWQLLATVYQGNPNVTRTVRVLLLKPKFVEEDLPAAVNDIIPRNLMNYLGFRALIRMAPFMPVSLHGLQRLFLLESSDRMEVPTAPKLCLRAVERAAPACLLKALVLPFQRSGASLWHRHYLSKLGAAFRRSVPQAAWLDQLSILMISYRLKHTRVDAFYPVDLLQVNTSCATGYQSAAGIQAGPLYSQLLQMRQQEILQKLPGALGYRLAPALDTEPIFSFPEQVVRVPVGLINASVLVNSTLFAFHLARVAVRLFAAMTPLLYESSVYEREIAFQFTDDSERQLEGLINCLLADLRRLQRTLRRPNMGLISGLSEPTLLGRWLLQQAGAVQQAFNAFRELLHVNRIWKVDFRYGNLRELSAFQLFFVYYALDQCEHSDDAFQRRQFNLRGQPSAPTRVNLPLRHVPEFAEAFGCVYGDNLRAQAPCNFRSR